MSFGRYSMILVGIFLIFLVPGTGLADSGEIEVDLVSAFDTDGQANDVEVEDGYAYVVEDHGLLIIDISTPSSPSLAGNYSIENETFCVAVEDDYAYVGTDSGIEIIDVLYPKSPGFAGSYETGDNSVDIVLSDGHAYVSGFWYGLVILDVSDPTSPVSAGNYYVYDAYLNDIAVSGDHAYLTSGIHGSSGLDIIDISSFSSPSFEGAYNIGDALGVAVSDDYVCVGGSSISDPDTGVWIFDRDNPSSPELLGNLDTAPAYDIAIKNNYACLANGSGLVIADISNPSSPAIVGSHPTGANSYDVDVEGDYAYVASYDNGLVVLHMEEENSSSESLQVGISNPDGTFSVNPGDSLLLEAKVTDNLGNLMKGSDVSVRATFSNGDESINLFDDGNHADGSSNDGVYANTWMPEVTADDSAEAPCTIKISARHSSLKAADAKVSGVVISETPEPSLDKPPNLIISDVMVDGTTINYEIKNTGSGASGSTDSYLYINDMNRQLASDEVASLEPGESRIESFSYTYESAGRTDTIKVVADATSSVSEESEDDNYRVEGFKDDGRSLMKIEILSLQDGFTINSGEPRLVRAKVTDNLGNPMSGKSTSLVTATFSSGGDPVRLFDDGEHNDENPDDGIYANEWTPEKVSDDSDTECTITAFAHNSMLGDAHDSINGLILSGSAASTGTSTGESEIENAEVAESSDQESGFSKWWGPGLILLMLIGGFMAYSLPGVLVSLKKESITELALMKQANTGNSFDYRSYIFNSFEKGREVSVILPSANVIRMEPDASSSQDSFSWEGVHSRESMTYVEDEQYEHLFFEATVEYTNPLGISVSTKADSPVASIRNNGPVLVKNIFVIYTDGVRQTRCLAYLAEVDAFSNGTAGLEGTDYNVQRLANIMTEAGIPAESASSFFESSENSSSLLDKDAWRKINQMYLLYQLPESMHKELVFIEVKPQAAVRERFCWVMAEVG